MGISVCDPAGGMNPETRVLSTNQRLEPQGCVVLRVMQDSDHQYSTVQYSTVQYSTVQYSTVQYSTVQYSIV